MNHQEIEHQAETSAAFELKRSFFDKGSTRSYEFRLDALRRLKDMVKRNERKILDALEKDLGKPEFEGYTSEIGILYEEINEAIKHLKDWMKPVQVSTPIVLHPSKSTIYQDPLGVVLIIGPWNYPFQLLMAPLIGAIAAGNCIILKPSDQTPSVSNVINELISSTFSNHFISVVQGPGALVGPQLIEKYRFDHIFFTGSPNVGRKIAEMAGRQLTPVTLELGGKSPLIVDQTANLDVAAKRIVWSKFFNAGQTCVCPDYLLVHESVKTELVTRIKREIISAFGNDPKASKSYGRIVNNRRVSILKDLMKNGRILHGGEVDDSMRYVAPTLIDNISLEDPIMQEEIFGPLLPILTYSALDEALGIIRRNRYPLALYLYTEDKTTEEFFINNVEFGGGCINNGMVHLANSGLPFGGVGTSGMGQYHGRHSFSTFSHLKSMISTSTKLDPSIRYAPYSEKKLSLARKFMR